MHRQDRIKPPGSVEPDALDAHSKLHRDMADEEQRPAAHPLGEASGYPPNCAHGMNSFADGRYDLALARLLRG
jgi:hypothetical protein